MKRKTKPHKLPRYLRRAHASNRAVVQRYMRIWIRRHNEVIKRAAHTVVDYLRDTICSPSLMHQFFKVEPSFLDED